MRNKPETHTNTTASFHHFQLSSIPTGQTKIAITCHSHPKELLKIPDTPDTHKHEEALFKCWGGERIIFKAQSNSWPEGHSHDFQCYLFLFMLSTHCQLTTHTLHLWAAFTLWQKTPPQWCISDISVRVNRTDLTVLFGTSSNNTRRRITLFLEGSQWRPINRPAIERPIGQLMSTTLRAVWDWTDFLHLHLHLPHPPHIHSPPPPPNTHLHHHLSVLTLIVSCHHVGLTFSTSFPPPVYSSSF